MEKNNKTKPSIFDMERPEFPKRAVITGGMPYGNKKLHFGHVGGVFVQADAAARFLRDRIGAENVIFVSGTDCYGSPIAESYRKLCEGGYTGTIEDFVKENHESQKETLEKYEISLNLFGASGLGETAEVHKEVSRELMELWYKNGWLEKMTTSQFYDVAPLKTVPLTRAMPTNARWGISICPKSLSTPKARLPATRPRCAML